MSAKKQIEAELAKLFQDRSYTLRKTLGIAGKDKLPDFTRNQRDAATERIKKLASERLIRTVWDSTLRAIKPEKHQWHVKRGKGWGRDAKKKKFKQWFEINCGYKSYIYIFWEAKKCIYVGQSIQGKTRPVSHFEKHWFGSVTRIDLIEVRRRSEVGKLECLAIHRFNPTRNKYRPADKKWAKKCPIHAKYRAIEQEMRAMFPIRRKKSRKKASRRKSRRTK